jgi:hypothetical protein
MRHTPDKARGPFPWVIPVLHDGRVQNYTYRNPAVRVDGPGTPLGLRSAPSDPLRFRQVLVATDLIRG